MNKLAAWVSNSSNLKQEDALQEEVIFRSERLLSIFCFFSLFVFGAANYIFYIKLPNMQMPIASAIAFLLISSPLVMRRFIKNNTTIIALMIVTASLGCLIVSASGVHFYTRLIEFYGNDGDQLGKTVIICFTSSIACLVAITYVATPIIGILVSLLLFPLGMTVSTLEGDVFGLCVGLMFCAIASILIQVSLSVHKGHVSDFRTRINLEAEKQKAKKAELAKSEFLANMSHEIRTPMNGVMGMAELLSSTELNTKQAMFTDVILRSGSSLLTIINDILDFSKLNSGKMSLVQTSFNLPDAVSDVATLVSPRIGDKDIEIIVRVDPLLAQNYLGDVGRFRQILTNLMGNAVKFTDSGFIFANIEKVESQAEDCHTIRVSVQDTGIGIPEDQQALVFEKFAQVDGTSTRQHEGTGLGLAITTALVELMGGEMKLESRLDEGSKFYFEVDLDVCPVSKPKVILTDHKGANILIVDDNITNQNILNEQMALWKFNSAAVSSGREALDFLDKAKENAKSIDCIILDYQMPGMSGFQVATEIRKMYDAESLPIIMLTSVENPLEEGDYNQFKINAHLTKPARSSLLLDSIHEVLSDKTRHLSVKANNEALVAVIDSGQKQDTFSSKHKGKLDVLVCEDNAINQIVITEVLNELGYSFHLANNGQEGVSSYKELSPSLVLMDISMPVMNGLDATAKIREIEAETGVHTPIIGVTAHALQGDAEKCIDGGMDDHLPKPISQLHLAKMIEKWMKNKDTKKENKIA